MQNPYKDKWFIERSFNPESLEVMEINFWIPDPRNEMGVSLEISDKGKGDRVNLETEPK